MKLKDVYQEIRQADITLAVMPRVSVQLTLQESFEFFASRNFFMFLVPLFMVLIGATTALFAMPLDGLGRAIYWGLFVLGYMVCASTMLICMGLASRYLNIRKFPIPVTCFVVVFGATGFAEFTATEIFNTIFSRHFVYMPLFLPQYLLILGIELIVIQWVIPTFLARVRDPVPEVEDDTGSSPAHGVVSANGQKFLLKDILLIQANQHYVTIRTEEKEALVRSTFKNILTQLPKDCGIQVHRSSWVSRKGVDIARSLNQPDCVVMSCGRRVAVSRSRQDAVHEWLTRMASAA